MFSQQRTAEIHTCLNQSQKILRLAIPNTKQKSEIRCKPNSARQYSNCVKVVASQAKQGTLNFNELDICFAGEEMVTSVNEDNPYS